MKRSEQLKRKEYLNEWMRMLEAWGATKCAECGYDRCFAAIEFHHPDPHKKEIKMNQLLVAKPTKERIHQLFKEVENGLTPLCANCHREAHYCINIPKRSSS